MKVMIGKMRKADSLVNESGLEVKNMAKFQKKYTGFLCVKTLFLDHLRRVYFSKSRKKFYGGAPESRIRAAIGRLNRGASKYVAFSTSDNLYYVNLSQILHDLMHKK